MGRLDIRIRHGGGGFDSPMLWIVIAIVALVVLSSAAVASVVSVLMTLAIIVASVIGGSTVLGLIIWFMTRGLRAKRTQAFMDYRASREEAYHRRQMDLVREKARVKATEHAAMAAMVAEAVRAGQYQTLWPQIGYQPPIRAEVVGSDIKDIASEASSDDERR